MKNLMIALVGFYVFITSNVMAAAPVDGHYVGQTSQVIAVGETGNEVSFDVINGVPQSFYFNIETCLGNYWLFETFGLTIQQFGDNYAWENNAILDVAGQPARIAEGSNVAIYGSGTFVDSTTFVGELWNAGSFFSGNGFETTFCVDTSATFQASYVGPTSLTKEITSSKERKIVVIEQE